MERSLGRDLIASAVCRGAKSVRIPPDCSSKWSVLGALFLTNLNEGTACLSHCSTLSKRFPSMDYVTDFIDYVAKAGLASWALKWVWRDLA